MAETEQHAQWALALREALGDLPMTTDANQCVGGSQSRRSAVAGRPGFRLWYDPVSMVQVHAVIARQRFILDRQDVDRGLRSILPEPLGDHYVVVAGKRFPPKQVISHVTGLDRADFNTRQARRVLSRLGFTVGRRSQNAVQDGEPRAGPHRGREADVLRPFMGQWIAQRGLEVLVAADRPEEVLAWLERHNQEADAMFLVPADETQAAGAAPM